MDDLAGERRSGRREQAGLAGRADRRVPVGSRSIASTWSRWATSWRVTERSGRLARACLTGHQRTKPPEVRCESEFRRDQPYSSSTPGRGSTSADAARVETPLAGRAARHLQHPGPPAASVERHRPGHDHGVAVLAQVVRGAEPGGEHQVLCSAGFEPVDAEPTVQVAELAVDDLAGGIPLGEAGPGRRPRCRPRGRLLSCWWNRCRDGATRP